MLFCGTDVGVYRSTDKGLTWSKFGTGLPSVSVYDLKIFDDGSALRAATHGRGMWELQIPANGNNPPAASIDLPTSNIVTKGVSVSLQGSVSDPDNGDFASGVWYFSESGDVITSGSGIVTTTHTFSRAGTFAISLTAKDSHGALSQSIRTFYVLNDPLQNCSSATPCVPVPPGLVSWWRAEGDARDWNGLNHGSVVNDMSFGQGRVCAGFSGDGVGFSSNAKKIFVPDSASLALTQSLTIEGWILINVLDPGGGYMIIQRGEKTFDTNIFGSYSLYTDAGRLRFAISASSSGNPNTVFVNAPNAIQANQYVHIAATLDNATGQMKLYQNGVLVSQTTTSVRPYGEFALGQNAIAIGGLPSNNVSSSVAHGFNGIIDELSLYNRALSASEIQAIYSAGVASTGAAGKCASVPSGPTIITEQGTTNRAAALDSVTWLRGPFRILNFFNFSGDSHTRVILFTTDLGLTQPDSSQLTVRAGGVMLSVEGVGPVTGVPGMSASYVIVRLPDGLPTGELPLVITVRGLASVNSPTLSISP